MPFKTLSAGAGSRLRVGACAFIVAALSLQGFAPVDPGESRALAAQKSDEHSGLRDFDWEIGTWTTRLKLLQRPLTGSTTWLDYEGTSVVSKVWNGDANLVELDVKGPKGRIQGVSLRLYNPQTRQWSLNFANIRDGVMTPPVYGGFRDGRGEFFGQDTLGGRLIFVKFVITPESPDVFRFEQSFSDDGGRTWEVNWIAIDTRVK